MAVSKSKPRAKSHKSPIKVHTTPSRTRVAALKRIYSPVKKGVTWTSPVTAEFSNTVKNTPTKRTPILKKAYDIPKIEVQSPTPKSKSTPDRSYNLRPRTPKSSQPFVITFGSEDSPSKMVPVRNTKKSPVKRLNSVNNQSSPKKAAVRGLNKALPTRTSPRSTRTSSRSNSPLDQVLDTPSKKRNGRKKPTAKKRVYPPVSLEAWKQFPPPNMGTVVKATDDLNLGELKKNGSQGGSWFLPRLANWVLGGQD